MSSIFFNIYYSDISKLTIKNNTFVTIMGTDTVKIVNDISKNINYITNVYEDKIAKIFSKDINKFKTKTVSSEFNYYLNKSYSKDVKTKIMDLLINKFNLKNIMNKKFEYLTDTEKIYIKFIISFALNPSIIIIDNLINELDLDKRKAIVNYLKEYAKTGKIVINFTQNIEESLYTKKLIIISNHKKIVDGSTKNYLKKDVIIKQLGYNLPFIYDLNSYLRDYELIDKYILNYERLLKKLWR